MKVEYPLFVLARDDRSIRKVTEESELDYYEQIDIEAGEYSAWDTRGYPVGLFWEPKVGAKAEIVNDLPQPDGFREAVIDYSKRYSEVSLDCAESVADIIDFFDAVEQHIKETIPPSLRKRIRRLFGR